MNLRLLYLTLALLAGDVCAEPQANTSEPLLQALSERSRQLSAVNGSFTQHKQITMLPAPLKSSGTFTYTRDNGIHWHVTEPVDSEIHITRNGLSLNGDSNALPAAADAQAMVAKIFMSVVVGDMAVLQEHFTVTASGTEQHWQLALTPKEAGFAEYLNQITLTGSEHTEQIEIDENNGDQTRIKLHTESASSPTENGPPP